ncbi:hypothetical protein HMPREF1565_3378 [Providencia alcalifaciens RIMD 1656011]|uniref:Uncharacterized protein n=1 Tax=Providencia alcalifaciens 205/92 TaxID=1256988 RepID=A0AAV3M668_9GAMM|nr:hypothetical protein HMPREF1567_3512 [Providencia alcalifaciens PAL-2]EUD03190.1 hypothetical protein HMPREF1565_3378 [Providencia alcalifaciens RIMD 1656011]EUD11248.1 hypothetical protein HMPREF1563_1748 [Providencia alcalifaciens 205/92]
MLPPLNNVAQQIFQFGMMFNYFREIKTYVFTAFFLSFSALVRRNH